MEKDEKRNKIQIGQVEITNLMVDLNPTMLTITLNANSLNISIKRLTEGKKRYIIQTLVKLELLWLYSFQQK